eukprot:7847859-Ditylum_brightwellii.AAC.1
MVPPSSLSASNEFRLHWSLCPHTYIAPYIGTPLKVNGDINKPEWSRIPWSSPFGDITGKEEGGPLPTQKTQMKMAWDDEYLYIAAIIHSDFPVLASFHDRNDPIYQRDSDFEVFIDPPHSCHNYKELEVNPINTVWNLMLNKPYEDDGQEHSGRIAKEGDSLYYEVRKQKTATKILSGSVNNHEAGATAVWSVEIAMSHGDTLAHLSSNKPQVGDRWRINFSRVEKKGDINWTWRPQIVWDPTQRKFVGKINMHLPDAWGYLQFAPPLDMSDDQKNNSFIGEIDSNLQKYRDPSWPAKIVAMNIYYAQRQYKDSHPNGKYASTLEELGDLVNTDLVRPFTVERSDGSGSVVISLTSSPGSKAEDKQSDNDSEKGDDNGYNVK